MHGASSELAQAGPGDLLDQHPGRFGFAQQLQKLGGEAHLGGAPDAVDRPAALQGRQGRMAAPDHVVGGRAAKGFGLARRSIDHHGPIGTGRLEGAARARSAWPWEGGTACGRAAKGRAPKGRTAKGAATSACTGKATAFRARGTETAFRRGFTRAEGSGAALAPSGAIGAGYEGAASPRATFAHGATAVKPPGARTEVARTAFA